MTKPLNTHVSILIGKMRMVAAPVGPQHTYWDMIASLEIAMKKGDQKELQREFDNCQKYFNKRSK